MSRVCTQVLIATVVCLIAAGTGWAQDAAARKEAQEKQAKMAEAQFNKMDKDADGKLSVAEFQGKKGGEKAAAIFKLLDKDNNGSVCIVEFKTKSPEVRFKTMDKNDDGTLTAEEFKGTRKDPEQIAKAEAMFQRMDKDSDGKVTLEELKSAQPKKPAKPRAKKGGQKKAQQQ